MISVTVASRDSSSPTLRTFALSLPCQKKKGSNLHVSIHHSLDKPPSVVTDTPARGEWIGEMHCVEIGHVCVSFSSKVHSLSRMTRCGFENVLPSSTVVTDVSLGRSDPSLHSMGITSHDQLTRVVLLELARVGAHFNPRQRRQVCSVTTHTTSHSQTQRANSPGTLSHPTALCSNQANLILTHCECEHPSTPEKRGRSTNSRRASRPHQAASSSPGSQSRICSTH